MKNDHGSGYGDGDGSGYWSGYGDGSGSGYGDGSGSGYGSGYGYGSGSGYGYGENIPDGLLFDTNVTLSALVNNINLYAFQQESRI